MNVILSGPDSCGKTTLGEKLRDKYNMKIIHSTATTRNTLEYHLDLLDYHDNTIFDRFSVGEMIFPKIYGRPAMLTEEEFFKTLRRVEDNNDIYIIFTCSDVEILKQRLIERGEEDYLAEIVQQCELYNEVATKMANFFGDYKNFSSGVSSTPSDRALSVCLRGLRQLSVSPTGLRGSPGSFRSYLPPLQNHEDPALMQNTQKIPRRKAARLCHIRSSLNHIDSAVGHRKFYQNL